MAGMISLGLFATQLQGLLWRANNANQLSLSRPVVSTSKRPWYAPRTAFAIVPWDNRGSKLLIDWLGRLSVTGRAQDADPLGMGDKFGHGFGLAFFPSPDCGGL